MGTKTYKLRHKYDPEYSVYFHIHQDGVGWISFGDPKYVYKGLMLASVPDKLYPLEHLRVEWKYLTKLSWQEEKNNV